MKENVKIIVGNIEDQDTQVIVNPTNAELIWEDETCNGVIMNKVGIQYYHECEKFIDRNGPLDIGVSMFGEIRIVFWKKEQYNLCRHLFE